MNDQAQRAADKLARLLEAAERGEGGILTVIAQGGQITARLATGVVTTRETVPRRRGRYRGVTELRKDRRLRR